MVKSLQKELNELQSTVDLLAVIFKQIEACYHSDIRETNVVLGHRVEYLEDIYGAVLRRTFQNNYL